MSTATLSAAPSAATVSWMDTVKSRFLAALAWAKTKIAAARLMVRRGFVKAKGLVSARTASVTGLGLLSMPEGYTRVVTLGSSALRLGLTVIGAGGAFLFTGATWVLSKAAGLVGRFSPRGERALNWAFRKTVRAGLWFINQVEDKPERFTGFLEDQLVHPAAVRIVTGGALVLGSAIMVDILTKGVVTSAVSSLPFSTLPAILAGGPATWAFMGGLVLASGIIGYLRSHRDVAAIANLANVEGMTKVDVLVPAGATQAEIDAAAQESLHQTIAAGEAALIKPATRGPQGQHKRRNR